jgi:translocation and assembly module TamA
MCLQLPARADTVVPIEVPGAPPAVAANISARFGAVSVEEVRRSQFRLRANRLVNEAVQALGYYQASFQLDITEQRIHVQLEPGPQVQWAGPQLSIAGPGSDNPEILKALAGHPFIGGTPLNHGAYEVYKTRLLTAVRRQGYPDALFSEHRLRVDVEAGTALPILALETGNRFRLRGIEFIGTRIDEDVLYELLDLEVGAWYRREMVGELQRELMDSGYFLSVEVQPSTDTEHDVVTLHAYILDEPKNRYNLGLGVASDLGIYGTLNWNRAIVNDRGHGAHLNTRVSKPIQNVTGRYTIPRVHPREDYLEWVVAWQGKDHKDTLSSLTRAGLNWRLDKRETKRSIGVNVEYEKFEQGSQSRQSSTLVLPTASWVRLKMPTPVGGGYRYGIKGMASSEYLGSDTNFFRVSVDGRYLKRFSERHSVLIRGEAGTIFSDSLGKIPSSKRFFAGGQDSVRGFAYESISPRDGNGALTGADNLVTGSVQYQWNFSRSWAVVGFVDSGKAYHNSSEPFRTGVGAGVRWSSPVGAVGIDVGFPIQDDEYSGYQVHFYLGPLI